MEFTFVGLGSDLMDCDSRIIRTGEVDRDSYRSMISHTDIAIQLRDVSNGESSAAVTDCLAAGVVTVVTDIGSFSEIPDDVVVKVPRDITDQDLAGLVVDLVDDHQRRLALSVAGLEYARRNSCEEAAKRMLSLLTSADESSPQMSGASAR